jgi:phosphoribosylformylglycinamidine synthase
MMQLTTEVIDFNGCSDKEVNDTLAKYAISLSPSEIQHIQNDILKRPPTLTECLLWSIEGSEHCSYKSSKNLLKTLPTEGNHLILGVGEDAAVVSVATCQKGIRYGVAISHESHNHPSQIVPFEGAATGVGGNVRDIACMGATVIAVADSLRFGEFSHHKTRWLNKEVVRGIASYGNALGIPNVCGDVAYHASYEQNCLVTVVSLGIVREDKVIHSYVPDNADGYALILIGKPTDNSGFGGASFASNKLDEEEANRGAVQEPNAFLERHILKANQALIEILDKDALLPEVAFKDLGAGGIGCASVELADGNGFGCEVNLDDVHVGMSHLHPSVILCAETQERFMWAVPESLVERILHHYNVTFDLPNVSFGAKASCVGRVTKEATYVVTYQGKKEVDTIANAVTEGLTAPRQVSPPDVAPNLKSVKTPTSLNDALKAVLSHPNVASQKPIYDHYDKQVQGRVILERGKAKAGVLAPFNDESFPKEIQKTGVALGLAQHPLVNQLSPYIGAKKAVINALERVVSTGASPQAITDCLCYGNPEIPTHMWAFEKGIEGIKEVCLNYHLYDDNALTLPIVAGNVSFYNATDTKAIAPSPMISCLGRMTDANKAIDIAFKQAGSVVLLLRSHQHSLAGSIYGDIYGFDDELVDIDLKEAERHMHFMIEAIEKGLLLSSNTIHEGGLIIELIKMSIEGQIGMRLDKLDSEKSAKALFSETGGFVFEADKKAVDSLETLARDRGVVLSLIGHTTGDKTIQFEDKINIDVQTALRLWHAPLTQELR